MTAVAIAEGDNWGFAELQLILLITSNTIGYHRNGVFTAICFCNDFFYWLTAFAWCLHIIVSIQYSDVVLFGILLVCQ